MNEIQKYTVIKAVSNGRKTKKRASVELGITIRHVNRLVQTYETCGKEGFVHGNRGRKPIHAMDDATRERIISIYLSMPCAANVRHYTEILAEEHQICYSDTTIRRVLFEAGILSPKAQRKTKRKLKAKTKELASKKETSVLPKVDDKLESPEKAHPSRPRKKYRGELIQMDASSYNWFGSETTHLHLAIDDASGDVVGGYFDTQETLNGYYNIFHQVLTNHGVPVAFLTDKRTVFEYNSKSKKTLEEDTFTQFGFACHQLGVEIKTSSIPQAKGRIERLNATFQSRLPVALNCAGIDTMDEANKFLKNWLVKFNRKFGNKTTESVFEEAPKPAEINLLLARVANRKVDSGHHIRYQNNYYLPIDGAEEKYFCRKSSVLVIEAFNGDIYINIDDRIYQTRKLLEHELNSAEFDDVQETKKERRKYIPPQSHPWKQASFIKHLQRIGKTLEEYEAEKTA